MTKNSHNFFDIIKHIIYLKKFIENQNSNIKVGAKKIDNNALIVSPCRKKINHGLNLSIEDLFELNKNDLSIITSYNSHPDKFLRSFYITIHGKRKKINTYSDNNYGQKLRRLHEKINIKLEFLFFSSCISFAYKKNLSIFSCLNKHLDSNCFIKIDIHHFFESIRLRNLLNIIRCLLNFDSSRDYSWYFE